jgi:hypothetical protein
VHRSEADNKTIVGGGYSLQTSIEQTGGGDPEEAFNNWAVPAGLALVGGGDKEYDKEYDKGSFDYEAENDVSDVAPDSYFGGGSEDQKPNFSDSRKKRNRKKGTTGTKRRKKRFLR